MLWLGLALSLAGGASIHSQTAAVPVGQEQVVAEGICVVATLAQVTEGIGRVLLPLEQVRRDDGGVPPPFEQVRRDDGGVPPPLDQARRDGGGVPPPSPSSIV